MEPSPTKAEVQQALQSLRTTRQTLSAIRVEQTFVVYDSENDTHEAYALVGSVGGGETVIVRRWEVCAVSRESRLGKDLCGREIGEQADCGLVVAQDGSIVLTPAQAAICVRVRASASKLHRLTFTNAEAVNSLVQAWISAEFFLLENPDCHDEYRRRRDAAWDRWSDA